MQEKDERISQIMDALTNPAKAPFKVTFEIFVNPDRKELANLEKIIGNLEKSLPFSFVRPSKWATTSLEEAETAKRRAIQYERDNAPPPQEVLEASDVDREKYGKLKKLFEEVIKKLDLKDPLIFYDDKALRIDIGYGPKEFIAIFSHFGDLYVALYEVLGVSAFEAPINSCKQQDYFDYLEAEKQRLITNATAAFSKPLPEKKLFPLSVTGNFDEATFVKDCIQFNKGLVIGERHRDKSPKQFLIDNMALLKSQGVTTLYMEHLLHECHQEMLDAYLKSPIDAPMPKRLELYLRHLDFEQELDGSATYINIVKSAKENGIRVVAIDSEATYQIGITRNLSDLNDTQLSIDRLKAMNISMLERFSQYNDGGKYIAFIGSGHVSTCNGVPGVSDLLGCPNIVIHDLKKAQTQEKIEVNAQYTDIKNITANFDFLYERNPKTKMKKIVEDTSNPNTDSTRVMLTSLSSQKDLMLDKEQKKNESTVSAEKISTPSDAPTGQKEQEISESKDLEETKIRVNKI